MEFNMNFDGVNDNKRDFEILPPDWYNFKITSAYDKDQDGRALVSRNGTPYLKLMCTEENSCITLAHCLFLDPEQSKRIYFFLIATGNEPPAGDVTISASMFEGKEFRGKIEVDNGHNRITRSSPRPSEQAEKTESFVPKEYSKKDTDPELEEDVPF